MLASLRSMPNMLTFRPADGNEVAGAYAIAVKSLHTPSVLALSRQACANLANSSAASVALGAYVVHEPAETAKVSSSQVFFPFVFGVTFFPSFTR